MSWPLLQSVVQVSVERVVNSLPEGVLIALLAWLLLRVTGRQNAGTRFAVWMTALLAVAGLPLLSYLAEGRLLTAGNGAGAHEGSAAAIAAYLPHLALPHITVPGTWAVTIFSLWAVAACLAAVRLIVGLHQVRAIRRSAVEIDPAQLDPAVKAIVEEMSAPADVSMRAVVVTASESVRVPAAIGFHKPMIVLPAWALQDLSAEELKTILLHEHAHLQRRDDWTNLLQKVVRAVFFFHPAVWWIDAKLSLEREMACDDAVLAETGNPRAYAGCLISLLEKSCARRGWAMAQAAVGRAREASLRIAQILDAGRPGTTRVWKPALGLAGVLSLAGFGVLLCAPRLVMFAPEAHQGESMAANSYRDVVVSDIASGALPKSAIVSASLRSRAPLASWRYPAVSASAAEARYLPVVKTAVVRTHKPVPAVSQPVLMANRMQQPADSVPETLASEVLTQETASGTTLLRETWVEEAPASAVAVAERQPAKDQAGSSVKKNGIQNSMVLVRTAEYVETDAAGHPVRAWRVILIQHGLPEDFVASVI